MSYSAFQFVLCQMTWITIQVLYMELQTCNYIKDKLLCVSKVEYFSDGCAGQYKNFENYINLCHHKVNLNIDASWSFFTTSHGKSPYDRVGGTVKCKITRASLQRPLRIQILSFSAVEEFCQSITGIKFFSISKDDMVPIRENLLKWYELGSNVEGTRSCHYFVPESTSKIVQRSWVWRKSLQFFIHLVFRQKTHIQS